MTPRAENLLPEAQNRLSETKIDSQGLKSFVILYDIPTLSNADIKVGARNRIRSAGSGGMIIYLTFSRCLGTPRLEGRFVKWVGEQNIFTRQSFTSSGSYGNLKANLQL